MYPTLVERGPFAFPVVFCQAISALHAEDRSLVMFLGRLAGFPPLHPTFFLLKIAQNPFHFYDSSPRLRWLSTFPYVIRVVVFTPPCPHF